ncbi:MAG: hypothetical protein ACRD2F_06970, partial [Terriglobales bacterium]
MAHGAPDPAFAQAGRAAQPRWGPRPVTVLALALLAALSFAACGGGSGGSSGGGSTPPAPPSFQPRAFPADYAAALPATAGSSDVADVVLDAPLGKLFVSNLAYNEVDVYSAKDLAPL